MLEALRKGTGSWVVKILLGLLVVSFAIWGIGRDTFSGIGQTGVATVGDTEITPNEFLDAFQREVRSLSARFGGQLDTERARQFGLHETTLQRLISRALYDEAVKDIGLGVPDAAVARAIRNNPAFKGATGEFDRFQYEGVLRNSGLSPAYFEFQTRKDMVRSQLLGAVSGGTVVPRAMAEAIYRYRQEKRVAEFAVFSNASMTDIPDANDTTLIKFHEDNKAAYTAPEYRALTWLVLAAEDVSDDVAVSDEDIKEEYDARIDEFITPEKRDVDQLLFAVDDEAGAKAASDRIAGGTVFGKLFDALATENKNLTSLGTMVKSNLPEEAQDAVFALVEGGVTTPIKTAFGWHLFRVSKVAPGSTKSMSEASAELKKQIQLRRAAETLYKLSANLEDELAGGASLQDAAARFGLKVHTAAKVDARGQDENAKAIDLPKISDFLSTAFETNIGVEPALKESQDGSYFLVQVTDIIEPAVKPFETVRAQVTEDWKLKQQDEAAATTAADLIEILKKGGGNLSDLASAMDFKVKTSKPMTRFSAEGDADISFNLLAGLFKVQIGEAATAATTTNNGHVVAVLKSIEVANPAMDTEAVKKLGEQINSSLSGDLLAQYQMALQDDYEVKVYRNVLDSLF
jgi:peptidyl-prolyl cis-trans isomerase D